jgi:hypothetical protein
MCRMMDDADHYERGKMKTLRKVPTVRCERAWLEQSRKCVWVTIIGRSVTQDDGGHAVRDDTK